MTPLKLLPEKCSILPIVTLRIYASDEYFQSAIELFGGYLVARGLGETPR